ncbi:MAG: ABC transporter ATP-binding protein [Burkholderiaceae bacterium]|nr:ABC transporter ATP-binding protein [Burkholderiaceae bacterium]
MPLAIRARGLRKAYRLYARPIDALVEALTGKRRHVERVALDNVDLELRRGEIVGVLGRNGAGKSTLLKIIAGTLERTAGELEVHGRITAILELGTGFHPEYTGRENIYMGGLCLGMSRAEIDAKLESIIDFSELRDVIDQPFKTYSTGMQARLTFSTAISVDPDILIVDEALSVGDARFQLKCFGRMQQLRANRTTVLLVSHDTNTITTLCDRALILENGKVHAEGDSKRVSVLYHNMLFGRRENGDEARAAPPSAEEQGGPSQPSAAHTVRYGSGEGELLDWALLDASGARVTLIESGSPFSLSMTLFCAREIEDLSCGFAVKDRRGTVLWGVTNLTDSRSAMRVQAGETLSISASGVMWLAAGDYFVTLGAAHLGDGGKIDFVEDAIGFRVLGPGNIFTTSVVNMQSRFVIESADRNREACA